MEGKTVGQSRITMARTMQPTDANGYGNVHGGAIMRFVDEAAGAVAIRHGQGRAVTASIEHMDFKAPVHIGDIVTIEAYITYVGRSSMEVECQVRAEQIVSGEARQISTGILTFVAIDEQGRSRSVPPLLLEGDAERARWDAAVARRSRRRP